MSTPARGFTVTVQRGQFAATNGLSRDFGRLTVVGFLDESAPDNCRADTTTAAARVQPLPDDLQPDLVTWATPAVWLRCRLIVSANSVAYMVEPITELGEPRRFMFGGNLAGSDDPRWLALTGGRAWVNINDRTEP